MRRPSAGEGGVSRACALHFLNFYQVGPFDGDGLLVGPIRF